MAPRGKRTSKLDPHLDKLGVLPDRQVAELAGVTVANVRAYRLRHGVAAGWRAAPKVQEASAAKPAPKVTRPRKSKLDPFMDKVGIVPDREVAELAGVSAENVRAFRKRRGIPASWRAAEQSRPAPASAPVSAPAKRSAAPRKAAAPRKSKLDPYMDKVGVMPDRDVAELAGVSAENVRAFRKRRGIPADWRSAAKPRKARAVSKPPVAAAKAGATRRGKLTPHVELIGILSDSHVARLADTAAQNVRAYRLRHGIPARWRGEGQPLPNEAAILALYASPSPATVAPEAPAAPPHAPTAVPEAPVAVPEALAAVAAVSEPAGLEGYAVTVQGPEGEISYVVVANDIAEAAAKAVLGVQRRGIQGRLLSVRFLARALGT